MRDLVPLKVKRVSGEPREKRRYLISIIRRDVKLIDMENNTMYSYDSI